MATKLQLSAVLIVVLAGLLLAWIEVPAQSDARTGPRTMEEVIALVEKLGLHYRSDQVDGVVGLRLVVSDSPLTWQRANAFRTVPKKDCRWSGTVAVLRGFGGVICMDEQTEAWGDFFVYGDPSLVERLRATATSEGSMP
jgi:hypothetical protein